MKRDFLERDMYDLVKDHFEKAGYKVHGEVKNCDITATKEGELIILEMKKSLTVDLLLQGVKRQRLADLTYLCIPKPKKFSKNRKYREVLYLLKRLSLGLILVDPAMDLLEVALEPQQFDMKRAQRSALKQRRRLEKEIQGRSLSLNAGGSRGAVLLTAYREEALKLLHLTGKFGQIAPKDGKKLGLHKAPGILRDNYYGWFSHPSRGVYGLTPEGQQALKDHEDMLMELCRDLEGLLEEMAEKES